MKDSDVEKSEEEGYFTSSQEDEFEEKSKDDCEKEESDEEWKEGSGGIYINKSNKLYNHIAHLIK